MATSSSYATLRPNSARRGLPPVCHDAAECIRKLFEYMELELEHVVFGKLYKLKEMGDEDYALAHPPKPKEAVYSSKLRNMTIKVSKEQVGVLQTIFRFYCSIGEKRNFQYLSRQQFLRFARDASLVSFDIDLIELDLLFDKINRSSAAHGDHQLRLSLPEFVMAVASAAARLYPEWRQEEAFEMVMTENVKPLLDFVEVEDAIGDVLIREDALSLIRRYEKPLKMVFRRYASEDQLVGEVSFRARVQKQSQLSQAALLKFAGDFDLMPDLLSLVKVTHCFQQTVHAARGAKQQLTGGMFINFDQFLECLGRLALLAFNYEERPSPRAVVQFSGNYSAAAKSLWSACSTETVGSVPEAFESEPMEVRVISPARRRASADPQVPVPPFLGQSARPAMTDSLRRGKSANQMGTATIEPASLVGTAELTPRPGDSPEEAVRKEGAALRRTVSRSGRPASARGAARSRPPSAMSRSEPLPEAFISADPEGGAMTSRATVAQRAKFSSDWIGKPKKPLMRDNCGPLPKLQFKNLRDLYQTDGVMQPPKDAPTIYHARMHDMVSKRVEIEQTIDDKIMAWHLEGRDMQRAALEAKKERRVELMAKSDQLRPISSRGVRRHTKGTENGGDGSFISDTSNPRQMRQSGRSGAVAKPKRLLKTSTQLLEETFGSMGGSDRELWSTYSSTSR